jgi:hypothetical protein
VNTLAPLTPSAAGVPTVDEALAPASVRNGSATVKQDYAAAQGFEEMLLAQLSSSLVQSSGLSGEGGEGGSEGEAGGAGGEEGASAAGGGGMLSSLLPQALAEGVMHGGGLGLASHLMGTLDPSASAGAGAVAPAGGASGGSPAGAAGASDGSPAGAAGGASGSSVAPGAGPTGGASA